MYNLFTNVDQEDLIAKMDMLTKEFWQLKLRELEENVSQTRRRRRRGQAQQDCLRHEDALKLVVWAKKEGKRATLMSVKEIKKKGWRDSPNKKVLP